MIAALVPIQTRELAHSAADVLPLPLHGDDRQPCARRPRVGHIGLDRGGRASERGIVGCFDGVQGHNFCGVPAIGWFG